MEMNEVLEKLPRHLLDLVIDQPYNEYTAQDHALWRYVMKQNVIYLGEMAHGSYTDGLHKTGISIDSIPHMYGMNRILKEIGWAAVAVDGFIPPAAFMEFQAYNVLVIAADIRPISQIEYTPAPDIIHEAAGHAPIIADSEYAEYLRLFGKIGSKAFSSAANHKVYEAIRHLSILKSDPYTSKDDIAKAEQRVAALEQEGASASEMTLIRNLHWWTVEYGLIGDINRPKIYGAGLLSSIGESKHALSDKVKKLPFDLSAKDYSFDITTMQPQLFVTPDFAHLTKVLKEFEQQMALNIGGTYGITKAIESGNDATCRYSSGLEVSGIFSNVITDGDDPVYLQSGSPTTLNYQNKLLPGHGKDHHPDGYGSPIGKFKNVSTPPELLSESELEMLGISKNQEARITFESGVLVEGILREATFKDGKLLLLSFRDCKVKYRDKMLFEPEWGLYDMAIGTSVDSCFNGPADPDAYGMRFPVPEEKTHKIIHSEENKKLFSLYQLVRDMRETNVYNADLSAMMDILRSDYPDDWLLSAEIYEFAVKTKDEKLAQKAKDHLEDLKSEKPEYNHLIQQAMEHLLLEAK
jgi:phenylalanine-4-hydroxylase